MIKFNYQFFFAATVFFVLNSVAYSAVVTLSPGIAYHKSSGKQTLLLQTSPQDFSNQYVSNNNWDNTFAAQLFIGNEFYKNDKLKLNLGVTLGIFDSIEMKGVVNQFALSDYNNLNYQYDVRSLSAMATVKLFYLTSERWQPYIEASAGVSNNYAFDYEETARILGAEAMNPFNNHSINSFAYRLGVGFMYQVNKIFSVGLGYQFSDIGNAKLGVSADQQTNQTLTADNIYLHQLLFNLNWNT